MLEPILNIKNLSVEFHTERGEGLAVRSLSLGLNSAEVLAIVGESGCGKSVLCKAILGMLPSIASRLADQMTLNGIDLMALSPKQYTQIRGKEIAMVFQNPMSSLNPVIKVGRQIKEAVLVHDRMGRKRAKERAIELMEFVGIEKAKRRYHSYPSELSGGMRQRCAIAMALACHPKVLIADEITTALDVITQKEIIKLLLEMRKKMDLSILFISHDFNVIAQLADRIAVMYAGRIIEIGTTKEILNDSRHPYTQGLMASIMSYKKRGQPFHGIFGMPPDPFTPIKGDAFAPRNPYALAIDYQKEPPFFSISSTHFAASWLLDERASGLKLCKNEAIEGA